MVWKAKKCQTEHKPDRRSGNSAPGHFQPLLLCALRFSKRKKYFLIKSVSTRRYKMVDVCAVRGGVLVLKDFYYDGLHSFSFERKSIRRLFLLRRRWHCSNSGPVWEQMLFSRARFYDRVKTLKLTRLKLLFSAQARIELYFRFSTTKRSSSAAWRRLIDARFEYRQGRFVLIRIDLWVL